MVYIAITKKGEKHYQVTTKENEYEPLLKACLENGTGTVCTKNLEYEAGWLVAKGYAKLIRKI